MIQAQLAKQAEVTSLGSYINDDNWVIEQKLDGHRILLMAGADGIPTAITRNGDIYSKRLPKAIAEFRFPTEDNVPWVLDGELVGDTFWVFDMPGYPHLNFDPTGMMPTVQQMADKTPYPLWLRRNLLEAFMDQVEHPFKLIPQAKTPDEKIHLAETSLQNNYEGLVLKNREAVYASGGRTPDWLKVKYVTTADCVVLDVRDDFKDSVRLGMYDPSGAVREVGRSSLIGKEKNGLIAKGDVLEVKYLYCGSNGRLYQPTIVRKRDDKSPQECTDDQLKYVNKDVLQSL